MTNITPNAYDRLYELGITSDDYTSFFSGKQSPYIADQIATTAIPRKPDSFETKSKKIDINTAKKIGFGALVGYLALAIAGRSKNPITALENLKPFAKKVIDKIKNHFTKVPTP